jgi:DNA-binding NtrC family response regulator
MRILLADEDRDFCNTTAAVLRIERHEVACAYSEAEASELLRQEGRGFEVAILDMYMEQDDSGLRLLKLIAEQKLPTISIVLTGHGKVSDAVASMNAGAFDYVEKGPPEQVDLLLLAINRAGRFQQARTAAGRATELVKAAERVASRLQGVFREIDNVVDDLRRISDEVARLTPVDEEATRGG